MKRVFLSFAAEDTRKVKALLSSLASPQLELDFYEFGPDVDFDSDEGAVIKRAIGEKIVGSSVTVCLISENSHKSKWVDCGLTKSRNKGNRIIAMALKGTECAVLPQVVREENLKFYPWNPRKLAELILS
jgi:hypothetical protein